MVAGSITEQVAIIGKIAAEGDIAGVGAAKGEMIRTLVLADPLSSVHVAAGEVGGRIAYLAGYLPPELGNEALRLFDAEHPIFGKVIPDDMESAFATGKQLGKQFALKKQIEAENAKKLRQAAELGVVVPDGEQEVSSDDASKLLNAIRAKRALKGDPLAAKELAESKDWEAERQAREKEKVLAAIAEEVAEEEEEEDEYAPCPQCGEEDTYLTKADECQACGYSAKEEKAKEEERLAREAEEHAKYAAGAGPKIEYDSPF